MGADSTLSHRTSLLVIVFLAIGVWNATEVFIKILQTFRAYRGVYFWSLIAASIGIILHALGYFFRNFQVIDSLPLEIFLVGPGGMMMITGQSIVLYTRLHLVSRDNSQDRWLLIMILIDLLVIQVGATTLYAGSQTTHPETYLKIYKVWERFQVTAFFAQECIISGLYIYRTYILLQGSTVFRGVEGRRVLIHLVLVNFLVIALDVTVLAFQYAGLYEIQTSWKTLAYSVKLKFEFAILNRLVNLTKSGLSGGRPSGPRMTGSNHTMPDGRINGAHSSIAAPNPSRFGNNYARMEDDGGMQLNEVTKTTQITVKVEEECDGKSESSTRGLREINDIRTSIGRAT
ncbi:hypothetical protein P154DRAFT_546970 [Amniculicola lignicola CBS 123094]|uniref:DUF7703 domain-containing protein n=1 Tax=Amniculicola lignicola CBS 123094 TaxID=1392246 RepID=A0A6A5WK89_9PLEO|nr:hypothetical protein P154DRAFT_546970 [Amniculicola lignicola CBS 123094]